MDEKDLIFSIYSFKFHEGFGIEKRLNRYDEGPTEMLPAFISRYAQCPKINGIKNRHAEGNNNL